MMLRKQMFAKKSLEMLLAEMRGEEQPTNHRHRQQGAAS